MQSLSQFQKCSLGRAWAHLELMWTLLHWHLRSVSIEGCASGSASEGPQLEKPCLCHDLVTEKHQAQKTRSTVNQFVTLLLDFSNNNDKMKDNNGQRSRRGACSKSSTHTRKPRTI